MLGLVACAHPAARRDAPPAPGAEVGIASYYASFHEGRLTASGVPYDGKRLTCAHKRLPFGTRLRVTDVESGRSVVCLVNDRGPFVKGRIVDLSAAAAKRLGIGDQGVVKVRIEPLGR